MGVRGRGQGCGATSALSWLILLWAGCNGPGLEPPWGGGEDSAEGGFGNMGSVDAPGVQPPAAGTGGASGPAGMAGMSAGTGGTPTTPSDPMQPTTGGSPGTGTAGNGAPSTPGLGDFSGCEVSRIPLPGPTAMLIAPVDPPLADAGAASSCEYLLPVEATPYLPDLLNVQLQTLEGATATLDRVTEMSACDPTTGGFYYDDAASPTRIIVCLAHCGFPVEIVLGCPTLVR